jgi:FkbH-like protein
MNNEDLRSFTKNEPELNFSSFSKKIKVAFLSSFTIDGIVKPLRVKCGQNQIQCITFLSDYNQYHQEILNPNSSLYNFKPDLTYLFLDTRSILGDLYFNPYSISSSKRKIFIESKFNEIKNLIDIFLQKSNSTLVLSNFLIPNYSPYGILENKTEYGLFEMIIDLNQKITDFIKSQPSTYIFDFNGFVSLHGENNIFDYRQFFIGDLKIALKYFPILAEQLLGYIKPIIGKNKKCIVLDLDNTLWGGIVGEDGFNGIKLGKMSPGNAYIEFQKTLSSLWEKGILLAINSKNNFKDAMEIIQNHPNMILREKHFACVKINWNDKSENMIQISKELNLSLDSFVYFDDDPVNRLNIQRNFPEILTVDIPKDPSQYAQILRSLNDFNTLNITDEDKKRGKMYWEQKNRLELEKSFTNLDEYLGELNIQVIIKTANDFLIPRISQLTLKTNQFNLTTKRYPEEEIRNLSSNENVIVGCANVRDKFGDNGITCVFIINTQNTDEWFLDSFLLSCRIMGRKIEEGIIIYLINKAIEKGIKRIKAQYTPTSKNKPCENFLSSLGFKSVGEYEILELNHKLKIPEHLKVIEDDTKTI